MSKDCLIIVIYKYTTELESPTYWFYKEEFPQGWFWVKEDKLHSEHLEYFQGIEKTKKEMLEYLEKKFTSFHTAKCIEYFRFI